MLIFFLLGVFGVCIIGIGCFFYFLVFRGRGFIIIWDIKVVTKRDVIVRLFFIFVLMDVKGKGFSWFIFIYSLNWFCFRFYFQEELFYVLGFCGSKIFFIGYFNVIRFFGDKMVRFRVIFSMIVLIFLFVIVFLLSFFFYMVNIFGLFLIGVLLFFFQIGLCLVQIGKDVFYFNLGVRVVLDYCLLVLVFNQV